MIFYEIVEQDFKVGDYIKETTVPELTYQITSIGPKVSSDYRSVTISDHTTKTSYVIKFPTFDRITLLDTDTLKDLMCGKVFHAKLIKP